MYIVKWPNVNNNAAVYKIYQSTNGTSWTSPQTVTFPEKRDAIIKVGSVWRMGYHRLASQGYPNYRFWTAISTNGRDFVQDQASLFNCGEDISLFYNTDSSKYYSYLRPIADTVHRKIG